MTQRDPSRPGASATTTAAFTAQDFECVLRAAKKVAARLNVSVEQVLTASQLEFQQREGAGGIRAGAGRPARDWAAETTARDEHGLLPGFAFDQIPLAMAIGRALAPTATDQELFAKMVIRKGKAGPEARKLYTAYRHAARDPAASTLAAVTHRRAERRAAWPLREAAAGPIIP